MEGWKGHPRLLRETNTTSTRTGWEDFKITQPVPAKLRLELKLLGKANLCSYPDTTYKSILETSQRLQFPPTITIFLKNTQRLHKIEIKNWWRAKVFFKMKRILQGRHFKSVLFRFHRRTIDTTIKPDL